MLAETVHSAADSCNELLLLVGRRRARRGGTLEHPFGFARERYFYGFVVAVMLFTIGGGFSVYDGVNKILHPEPIKSPLVAFIVLGVSIILESFSLRTAVSRSNAARSGQSWGSFIRRAKAPELPVVLLEDAAALTGLAFALIGITLAVVTGNGAWDGAGSLAIGAVLGWVAVILAIEMKSLLIGEAANEETERAIVAALEDGPELECVIHLRTVHLGPETLLVGAKVAVRADLTAAQLAAGINTAEQRVRTAVPIAELIYLEPDLYRPALEDSTDPAVQAARRAEERPW
jgi:cation diffusion facilitator family transporter